MGREEARLTNAHGPSRGPSSPGISGLGWGSCSTDSEAQPLAARRCSSHRRRQHSPARSPPACWPKLRAGPRAQGVAWRRLVVVAARRAAAGARRGHIGFRPARRGGARVVPAARAPFIVGSRTGVRSSVLARRRRGGAWWPLHNALAPDFGRAQEAVEADPPAVRRRAASGACATKRRPTVTRPFLISIWCAFPAYGDRRRRATPWAEVVNPRRR